MDHDPSKGRTNSCCASPSVIPSIHLSNILLPAVCIMLEANHAFSQIFVLDELRQVVQTSNSKFLPNEHLSINQQCLDSSTLSHNKPARSLNGHAHSDTHIYYILADLSS